MSAWFNMCGYVCMLLFGMKLLVIVLHDLVIYYGVFKCVLPYVMVLYCIVLHCFVVYCRVV